jgi:hypothetical protein
MKKMLTDLEIHARSQVRKYESNIYRLAQEFDVEESHLQKLCIGMNVKIRNAFVRTLNTINNELEAGLNINQIIIKYELDKELI